MSGMRLIFFITFLCFIAQAQEIVSGTKPLALEDDLSAQMVAGIDRFLMREIENSVTKRQQFWKRDFSGRHEYEISIQPNREHLRRVIGAIDQRVSVTALELVGSTELPTKVAETGGYEVFSVRWPVFENVFGEGLWLKPKQEAVARVIAIPDADQTPEMLVGIEPGMAAESQFARRLAENGCEILVPVVINRDDTFSGNPKIRFTNQPHREWIYRQAYEMGRHIIGYEVQKVLAAVDFFSAQNLQSKSQRPVGVAGYGEGGLIAFCAAALDTRIEATLVSGYFDQREKIWSEPIYRNLCGLLREFGDAETATLIAPRALIVEYSAAPKIDGPPSPHDGRSGAAPGKISTPDYSPVRKEFERANALLKDGGEKFAINFKLVPETTERPLTPGSEAALREFANRLGIGKSWNPEINSSGIREHVKAWTSTEAQKFFRERQQRQIAQLTEYTQKIFRDSERARAEFFWNRMRADSPTNWTQLNQAMRSVLHKDIIGKIDESPLPANARSRKILENEKFTSYDVVLDVYPDVFAWGILLLPKDLKSGERRPLVVCQHGLEGVPMDTVTQDRNAQPFPYYKGFSSELAARGFIVFAPHNPYRGGDKFRVLQRKANPLGLSLFSFIIAQHDQILNWLSEQPFVDPQRIGFYGLSYGGKTAMRVPAVLDRYALSICSGDFNEWICKCVNVDFPGSYMFTGEYEMPEWNLGNTFNYAEMAALIAPRPFMVERGHSDGVGRDEWVSYEYAKVRRLYDQLGIGDRTEIEFFNGPHTIHGEGTFEFLHKNLHWPQP